MQAVLHEFLAKLQPTEEGSAVDIGAWRLLQSLALLLRYQALEEVPRLHQQQDILPGGTERGGCKAN